MEIKRIAVALFATLVFVTMSGANVAHSQTRLGLRGGSNLDRDDLFLGAHVIQDIGNDWIFTPNFEYTFVEQGSFFTINSDFHYDFPSRAKTIFWLGAGLGISHFAVGDRDKTDVGLNLLSGVSFGRGPNMPFIQVKVSRFDNTELLIGGGITF